MNSGVSHYDALKLRILSYEFYTSILYCKKYVCKVKDEFLRNTLTDVLEYYQLNVFH